MKNVPHRIYLTEDQMPRQWYNLRADMKEQPDPMINPATGRPATEEDLYPVFCKELAHQEMDSQTRYVDIPEPVQRFYRMYRPSPLIRAYELEKALDTPARIYYKFEGNAPGYISRDLRECSDIVSMLDAKMLQLNEAIIQAKEAQEEQTGAV